jgi:hypothetical protein
MRFIGACHSVRKAAAQRLTDYFDHQTAMAKKKSIQLRIAI